MKHTVCFIDDKIPVSQFDKYFKDTDIINESVLAFLLKNETTNWEDATVKKMCEKLLDEADKWSISAFTSPNFYDNYIKETVYAPEIIIFDWDYNAGSIAGNSEECLLSILQSSYTMIFIFSAQDNITEINEIVKKEEFQKFGDRLSVINKNENDSVNTVFTQIKQKEENNFSFRYGSEIIYKSNIAINKILSDISQLSIEDFISSIESQFDGTKYTFCNDAFIDAILPRYKNILRNYTPIQELSVKKTKEPELSSIRDIWSYRIYDSTKDKTVQMGDIIKKVDENKYYLVISSDCHMNEFWKKNFGLLSLIPLQEIGTEEAKERLKKCAKKVQFNISSISSNNQSSMTVLPCVPISDKLKDFLVIPKSIISIEIEKQMSSKLLYEDLTGFEKIVSVSDPFKSPLVQYVFDNISGYGCPDFHKLLKEEISLNINNMQS